MIQEDYISFETAKLLKEKGFDEICYLGYNKNGEYFPTGSRTNSQIIQPDFCFICCPTLQMTMKWLTVKHNIYYEIQLLLGEKAEKYGNLQLGIYQLSSLAYVWKDWIYADTYVELYEKYVKYCLENLI